MKTGPDIVKDGLVFGYDTGYPSADNETSLRFNKGEPVTNLFTTVGNASTVDQNVTFSVNGTGTFKRVAVGTEIGNYKVKDTDVVYSYELGTNGCHYHGNDYSSVSSGTKVSFSIEYFLTSDVSIVSNYLGNFEQLSGVGGSWGSVNSQTGVWHKVSFTRTATSTGNLRMLMYPGACGSSHLSAQGTIYYKNPTVTLTEHNVPFVSGTRSSTQSLIDLKETTDIDVNNTSFDSNAQITFDGTDDKINGNWPSAFDSDDNTTDRSWEVVLKTTSTGNQGVFGHKSGAGCSYYCNGGIFLYNGNMTFNWYDNSNYQFLSGGSITTNKYMHVVGTFDGSDAKPRIYVNGELKATYGSSTNLNYSSGMNIYDIGWNSKNSGTDYFNGEIPIVKYYKDKALSLSEVKQNYNAYKNRFGI